MTEIQKDNVDRLSQHKNNEISEDIFDRYTLILIPMKLSTKQ